MKEIKQRSMVIPIHGGCLLFFLATQHPKLHLSPGACCPPFEAEPTDKIKMSNTHFCSDCQALSSWLQNDIGATGTKERGTSEIHFENGRWPWCQLLPISRAQIATELTAHAISRAGAVDPTGSGVRVGTMATSSAGRFWELMSPAQLWT